jgi:hypothetical protein
MSFLWHESRVEDVVGIPDEKALFSKHAWSNVTLDG